MTDCSCLSHDGFLTVRGYEDAQRRRESAEALAVDPRQLYLDIPGSVSASGPCDLHWPPDALIEEQHRRFLDGS